MTVANGFYQGSISEGGCIYSAGYLSLISSTVTNCTIHAPSGSIASAAGGGAYAREGIYLWSSTVTRSLAVSADRSAYGGGVFTHDVFTSRYSTISNNIAITQNPNYSSSGGGAAMLGAGDATISGSTFFGNAASQAGAILDALSGTTTIVNSTISNNNATYYVGGIALFYSATISNSTVTSNSAGFADLGVGVFAYTGTQLTVNSSIFSSNWSDKAELDIYAYAIDGSKNIILSSSPPPPLDTLVACPRLSELQDNGGPTLTRSLLSGSKGIDKGSIGSALPYDQRNYGFPRKFGPSVDIGAVEWQGDFGDSIFSSAFEVHCD
jgi:hypothetical protein